MVLTQASPPSFVTPPYDQPPSPVPAPSSFSIAGHPPPQALRTRHELARGGVRSLDGASCTRPRCPQGGRARMTHRFSQPVIVTCTVDGTLASFRWRDSFAQ